MSVADSFAGAPLDHHRRALKTPPTRVKQAAKQRRRDRERDACDDAKGPPRQRYAEQILLDHSEVRVTEAPPQLQRRRGIALNRYDAGACVEERRSQRAGTGSEVKDEIAAAYACCVDQLESELLIS